MNSINDASITKAQRISTNGVTFIKTRDAIEGRGKIVLRGITINTKGASSNVLKIYDSTEAEGAKAENLKASIDTTVTVGMWEYGFLIERGLYIVTETGTAPDATVLYAKTP